MRSRAVRIRRRRGRRYRTGFWKNAPDSRASSSLHSHAESADHAEPRARLEITTVAVVHNDGSDVTAIQQIVNTSEEVHFEVVQLQTVAAIQPGEGVSWRQHAVD